MAGAGEPAHHIGPSPICSLPIPVPPHTPTPHRTATPLHDGSNVQLLIMVCCRTKSGYLWRLMQLRPDGSHAVLAESDPPPMEPIMAGTLNLKTISDFLPVGHLWQLVTVWGLYSRATAVHGAVRSHPGSSHGTGHWALLAAATRSATAVQQPAQQCNSQH